MFWVGPSVSFCLGEHWLTFVPFLQSGQDISGEAITVGVIPLPVTSQSPWQRLNVLL